MIESNPDTGSEDAMLGDAMNSRLLRFIFFAACCCTMMIASAASPALAQDKSGSEKAAEDQVKSVCVFGRRQANVGFKDIQRRVGRNPGHDDLKAGLFP